MADESREYAIKFYESVGFTGNRKGFQLRFNA